MRREPIALAAWVGIPMIITALFSIVFGGGEVTPHGTLLLCDQDQTVVSDLLPTAFSRGPLSKTLTVEKVGRDEGRQRIDRGDGAALLLVPAGFQEALLRDRPCELKLITNPALRILPNIVAETLSIGADAVFYLQVVAGDELRALADGPPSDQTVTEMSVRLNHLGTSLGADLDPPLLKLESDVRAENPGPAGRTGIVSQFFPGMLFMALLFVSQGQSADLWKERSLGTIRRLMTTPGRVESFLGGKVLSVAILYLIIGCAAIVCVSTLLQISVKSPVTATLWVTAAGTGFYVLMLLVAVYAPSERAASVLANFVLFLLAMVGGSFFPFESMPDWLAAVGRLTPNGWALVQFKALLAGTMAPLRLVLLFLVAALWITTGLALVRWRVRRAFVT
jgi:ABC-type Na+ efflux pump permease subunit